MALIALTGPDSVASGKNWAEAEGQELNLATYQALKPNQIIKIDVISGFNEIMQVFLKVGRRSTSKKFNLERIKLITVKDESGEPCPYRAPYYFYNRQGNISAAHSNMPEHINLIRFIKK
tara:strand:- start:2783 stop:3142 length:360 start_codon:yes stop_codon:yes gene_type:complete